jgi:hypothetical protein
LQHHGAQLRLLHLELSEAQQRLTQLEQTRSERFDATVGIVTSTRRYGEAAETAKNESAKRARKPLTAAHSRTPRVVGRLTRTESREDVATNQREATLASTAFEAE